VFFDIESNSWYVLARNGSKAAHGSSPIHEKDAFVFFDESRCRGADMKLKPSAQATLTIGPSMCKDKLMHIDAGGGEDAKARLRTDAGALRACRIGLENPKRQSERRHDVEHAACAQLGDA
jgi:hypothetical protein